MDSHSPNSKLSILSDPAFLEFNRFVGAYKFGDPVGLLFSAAESFLNCEVLHRKAIRANVLGLPKGINQYYEKLSLLHNSQGLRRLQRAQKAVKQAIEMYPNVLKKEDELVSETEMKRILKDYDEMLRNELFEMDVTPEEAEEIWVQHDKARRVVDTKGMSGLIRYFQEKMADLEKGRKRLPIGRKSASPLSWWKIVLIAAVLGVSTGSVVYCYKKKDCKWVWSWIKAVGGALYYIVRAGC